MKRILMSLLTVGAVGGLAFGATSAFFSDTETSTGNTIAAGQLDLKVDSESHYNGKVCIPNVNQVPEIEGDEYVWGPGVSSWPITGTPCTGTWEETDLGASTKFFDLTDVKPGDLGENTISLHVYDNDAWGRFVITDVQDVDNTCTEPESNSTDDCAESDIPDLTLGSGELAENITFSAWIDDGAIPGFQGPEDTGEGDNIRQQNEQVVILPGTLDEAGETHNIWSALAAYRTLLNSTNVCDVTDPDGDGQTDLDGTPSEDNYLACQGIATDGRMVGSTTYYFGLDWSVPTTVGNEAQTDSLNATLSFEVEQHRNNPTPFVP